MTAPSTNVPQALADEIASIATVADEAHQAEMNHWMDPLDNALSTLPPSYGESSKRETA